MDKSDNEIIEDMDFQVYLDLFNSVMPKDIDINYLNNKNISDEIRQLFNKTLIVCKKEFNIPLLLTLRELSTIYIEPKVISELINSRVRYELMEEIKNSHTFINKHYYNNTLMDYFF